MVSTQDTSFIKYNYCVIYQFTMENQLQIPRYIWNIILSYMENDEQLESFKGRCQRQAETLKRIRTMNHAMNEDNTQLTDEATRLEGLIISRNHYIADLEARIDEDYFYIQQLRTENLKLKAEITFYKRQPVRRRLVYNVDEKKIEYE